jgi:hypothetical protein
VGVYHAGHGVVGIVEALQLDALAAQLLQKVGILRGEGVGVRGRKKG